MAKVRSRALDYAIYLGVRCFVCFLQAIPQTTARRLAQLLAWLTYHLDHRHRLVAFDNLRQAFPGRYDEAELETLVRSVYRHFCTVLIEIVFLPRKLRMNTWRRYLEMTGDRQPMESFLSGRPFMFVTGHYGNWELAGYAVGLFGFTVHAVARPLDNPYLDEYMRHFRECTGQRLLAKKGELDRMQAIVESGGVLSTVADQDAGPRGLFVDFFGRPASTHKALALLALEHGLPILVWATRKVGEPMRYRLVIEEVIRPEEYKHRPDAVKAITQRYSNALERIIRAAPEQYFWVHRRWKHQPAAKKSKKASA